MSGADVGPFEVVRWAWDQAVPSRVKLVLVALASYADERASCYPSQKRLARDVNLSTRQVRAHLKWLEDQGYLRREARMRREGRGRTSDRYFLSIKTCQTAYDQPEVDVRLVGSSDDQPEVFGTTNRKPASGHELPENYQRTPAAKKGVTEDVCGLLADHLEVHVLDKRPRITDAWRKRAADILQLGVGIEAVKANVAWLADEHCDRWLRKRVNSMARLHDHFDDITSDRRSAERKRGYEPGTGGGLFG